MQLTEIVNSFTKTINIINSLLEKDVIKDYALIGGLALSAWIKPRTTQDIDIIVLISEDYKWKDFIDILKKNYRKQVFKPKPARDATIKEMISFTVGPIEVDLINTREFPLATDCIKNAIPVTVFKQKVKVATPEYLILLKLISGSEQDIIDIKNLLKVANKSQVKKIARKYLLEPKLKERLAW